MAFVVTPIVRFQVMDTLWLSRIVLDICSQKRGWFTYSNCMVASLLWFAHMGIKICGDKQLLSCFHLLDRTCISLSSQVNSTSHYFFGVKNDVIVCTHSFNFYDIKLQWVFHTHFFPENISSSMFQNPIESSRFNLKIYPWNLMTNMSEMNWKQPFHRLESLGVNQTKVNR